MESERKNFLRERDAANGKLAEIESSVSFHTDKIKEAQSDLALFEQRVERDDEGTPINKLTIKGVEDSTDIKVIAARTAGDRRKSSHQRRVQQNWRNLWFLHYGQDREYFQGLVRLFGEPLFVKGRRVSTIPIITVSWQLTRNSHVRTLLMPWTVFQR